MAFGHYQFPIDEDEHIWMALQLAVFCGDAAWERKGLPLMLFGQLQQAKELGNYQRAISLAMNLAVLLQVNYEHDPGIIDYLNRQMTALQDAPDAKEDIQEIIINFCGTGCPPFLAGSAHDDFLLEQYLEEKSDGVLAITIPGVGVSSNGEISQEDIRTGSGMAKRVKKAANFILQITPVPEKVRLTILGHSRGAVEALALGKLLPVLGYTAANTDCLVLAHDPVLGGSDDRPPCLDEPISLNIKDQRHEFTLGGLLEDAEAEVPGELKVFLRADDRRTQYFSILAIENAYRARSHEYVALPGYHNLGILSAAASNMDISLIEKSIPWMLRLLSRGANQDDGGKIDRDRDRIKTALFEDYKDRLVRARAGYSVADQPLSEEDENAQFYRYCPAVLSNPAYHTFCDSKKTRKMPDSLQRESSLYSLDRAVGALKNDEREAFIVAIRAAVDRDFDTFDQYISELSIPALLKLYGITELGLASHPGCNENDELVMETRHLTRESGFFRISGTHGRTKRWQTALTHIKTELIGRYDSCNDEVQQEAIRAVLSTHTGRLYTLGLKTNSITRFHRR